MPQLEGVSADVETIRTYYPFYISRFEVEQRNANSMREVLRLCIKKGVVDICSNCTQKGYYVVGLERGDIAQGYSPEEYYDFVTKENMRQEDIPYTLTLGLFVRRFAISLTGDELYYWSKQSTERILFEMSQLESRTFSNNQSVFTANNTTISNGKLTVGTLEEARRVYENTVVGRATLTTDKPKTEPKRTEYKIIRRPKCSNQNF